MALFGQADYAQAATRQIAQAAGVNEVTLFRQFGSQQNLLLACIQAHYAQGFAAAFDAELNGDYAAHNRPAGVWKQTLRVLKTLRV